MTVDGGAAAGTVSYALAGRGLMPGEGGGAEPPAAVTAALGASVTKVGARGGRGGSGLSAPHPAVSAVRARGPSTSVGCVLWQWRARGQPRKGAAAAMGWRGGCCA